MTATAYIIFGIVLLFFGAKFMKLALTFYGAILGILLASWFAEHLDLASGLTTLSILAGALLGGLVFLGFYKFLIKAAVALFVFNFAYGVILAFNASAVTAILLAGVVAIISYILMNKYDIVTKIFIIVSSLQGATAVITGITMLTRGTTTAHDIITSHPYIALQNSEWGFLAALIVALMGISVQLKRNRTSA